VIEGVKQSINTLQGIPLGPNIDLKNRPNVTKGQFFNGLAGRVFHLLGQLEFGQPITEMQTTRWEEEKY
jgi:hypothetical protein